MSFVHLMETEFMGITGTDCELRFFQYVISDATYNYFRRPSYVSMRSTRWRAVKIFATCYSVAAHGPTAVPLTKNENGGTHTSGGSVVKTYLLDEQPSCMFCLVHLGFRNSVHLCTGIITSWPPKHMKKHAPLYYHHLSTNIYCVDLLYVESVIAHSIPFQRYLQQLQRKNARPLDEGRYRYHETLRRFRPTGLRGLSLSSVVN